MNKTGHIRTLAYDDILPIDKISKIVGKASEEYKSGTPFPHIVLDDFFDSSLLEEVLEEFEGFDRWKEFDTKYEKKLQMNQFHHMGPVTQAFIHNLNAAPFLEFLEKLTGIQGLLPDPYLSGGGLHKIPRGGKLGIHVDFNTYKKFGLIRRVNVLVYLNKDWPDKYGGHLELWGDLKGSHKTKVSPIFNRMAIFTTTSSSFHGHPEPLTCPEDRCRRSLALYYYTAGDRGEQSEKEHSTIFVTPNGKTEELGKISFWGRVKRKIKSSFT